MRLSPQKRLIGFKKITLLKILASLFLTFPCSFRELITRKKLYASVIIFLANFFVRADYQLLSTLSYNLYKFLIF